ncbi:hypothetical protein BC937DRAFT_90342 [Endogone sp. FLAS-F59071]|nr:hypothetical protein BC937DRAFT_90342 [Endogone sp. FLAS-F59071]|eukprot:RUS23223.1 hypothetical protein BC937DRAFT_90342 [Endogone sp. FLAS-F59071]
MSSGDLTHLNMIYRLIIENMAAQLPSEILDVFVSEGVCTKADLPTVEIKPLDGGGVTDFVDGSSPNASFEVSFRGGHIRVFVKVNFSLHAYSSFKGEFHSLKAINLAVPQFAPTPLFAAPLTSTTGGYLITTYVHMSRVKPPKSHIFLARLLSRMHAHRSENGKFGFPVQTMCRPPPEYKDVGEVWANTWEEYFRDVMCEGERY